jgi:DNA-binding NtrC family response regulator
MPTILVIDDNQSVALALEVLFSLADINTISALTPEAGLKILAETDIDLVIQDMNFSADTTSGEDGVALFRQIRIRHPDLPVILLTAWTHLDAAVNLVKAGAADYLAKPWHDERLLASAQNLLELGYATAKIAHAKQRGDARKQALSKQFDLRNYVWKDAATEQVLAIACQVARADVPVLITGPNGAGKEGIAEIIRANSSVKTGAYVVLNCGAIPADLIEAELFGAEAGAYTGSAKLREGKFEAADGGTLFLDEIGNLPLSGQMKLLRVLETGRFTRLGSNVERQVKVRVISATNADLAQMIAAGTFREDLYYRLNMIELKLPPLAKRVEDILPLAQHFLQADKCLSADAIAALERHNWPGNVRELKNVIQRACLLSNRHDISVADLGLPVVASALPMTSNDLEPDRDAIEAAINRAGGVIAQAAGELNLSRQALYRRMERLGIKR